MSHRFHRIAAALALSLLSAAQVHAATFGTIAYTPPYNPQLRITCYTKVFFTSTNFQYFARQCEAGEKPLSVKTIYVG